MTLLEQILHLLAEGPHLPAQLSSRLGIPETALAGMLLALEQRRYLVRITGHTACSTCALKGWCATPTQQNCETVGLTLQGLQRLETLKTP